MSPPTTLKGKKSWSARPQPEQNLHRSSWIRSSTIGHIFHLVIFKFNWQCMHLTLLLSSVLFILPKVVPIKTVHDVLFWFILNNSNRTFPSRKATLVLMFSDVIRWLGKIKAIFKMNEPTLVWVLWIKQTCTVNESLQTSSPRDSQFVSWLFFHTKSCDPNPFKKTDNHVVELCKNPLNVI